MNPIADFVKRYAHPEAADTWREKHILTPTTPPVTFLAGEEQQPSRALAWTKTTGVWETVTDYPTEAPFQRQTLPITYRCADLSLTVELTLTAYPGYPVVEYDANLYYTGEGTSTRLRKLCAMDGYLTEGNGTHTLHGTNGSTYCYKDFMPWTRLVDAPVTLVSEGGKCTREYLPYFNLADTAAETGIVAILNWQGTWRTQFTKEAAGLRWCAGQNQTDFVLLPGEGVRFPGVALLFYRGDWLCGQNVYRRWNRQCNLFRHQGKHMQDTNILIGSPENRAESDLSSLAMYERTGLTELIDKFNIDAGTEDHGWYPTHGNPWSYTGNWQVDETYYPQGLAKISDAVHQAGLQFALWFEPERAVVGTDTAKTLAAHVIGLGRDGYAATPAAVSGEAVSAEAQVIDGNCLVNYGDPAAWNYMIELLDRSFRAYGVDQYRQDFNFDPAPYWSAWDKSETKKRGIPRVGITENWYCTGYLNLWRELLRRHPGMYFDACASGGMRYDLETMRYAFLHTRSDYWMDIESAQVQTYGSSLWFPYWGTGFVDFSDYDVRSHIGNSIGVGIAKDEDAPALRHALVHWKELSAYLAGDYYPLTPYVGDSRDTAVLQYDLPEEGRGMLMAYFRRGDRVCVSLRGLEGAAQYRIWDYDCPENAQAWSGDSLAVGFAVSGEERCAKVYMYARLS